MASYLAYPEYSPNEFPASWEQKRLRFALRMNPSKGEIDLEDSDLVSFVPMDAVGEYGGIRLSEEKELGEIGSGYTYFCDDDVVVAKITPCFENGKGALAKGLKNKTAFGTTELHVMRADREQLKPDFLFYLTISDLFRKIGESEMYGAGGQKRVPENFIKDFRAGLPSVCEQQAIARFLDFKTAQIDALIAKKKALLDKLAEKRTALISHAVTKGLDPTVEMKDSGVPWLGKIPAHWDAKRLKFCLSIHNGRDYKEVQAAEGYPVYGSGGRFTFANQYLHDGEAVLLGRKGTIDKPLYVNEAFWTVDTMYYATPLNGCSGKFAYYCATLIPFSFYSTDTALPSMTQGALNNHIFAVPPIQEQQVIIDYINKVNQKLNLQMSKATDVIDRLIEYRSALITNAVTGKIDVRGFEIPQPAEAQEPTHA